MAISTCAKCGGGFFEIRENSPSGSAYKLMFIQCSSCGAPIGVADYYNTGALIKQQEQGIAQLSSKVGNLEQALHQIEHSLRQIANRI